jgi:hypothetical protein
MAVNSSWDASATQYVEMYRYSLLVRQWLAKRQELIKKFVTSLGSDRTMFDQFFFPGRQEYSDRFDWDLKQAL